MLVRSEGGTCSIFLRVSCRRGGDFRRGTTRQLSCHLFPTTQLTIRIHFVLQCYVADYAIRCHQVALREAQTFDVPPGVEAEAVELRVLLALFVIKNCAIIFTIT